MSNIKLDNRKLLIIGLFLITFFAVTIHSLENGSYEKNSLKAFQNLTGEGTKEDPYLITDINELNAIRHSMNSTYLIVEDIDASSTKKWDTGKGFAPIGTRSTEATTKSFKGVIRGNNKTITGLTIHRPERTYTGLFGHTEDSKVKNLELISADIIGSHSTGILAGETAGNVEITNLEVTGSVKGGNRTGGLIGNFGSSGEIDNAYSTTKIHGNRFVGGLTGYNQYNSSVRNTHSKSKVRADAFSAGGLSGRNEGVIMNSSSNSTVNGASRVGGLVGDNVGKPGVSYDPIIANSFSDSWVDGGEFVGLFVGFNGLDVDLLQIEEKGYEVRIENSYYRERKNLLPIGRNKGDYTNLSSLESSSSYNRKFY